MHQTVSFNHHISNYQMTAYRVSSRAEGKKLIQSHLHARSDSERETKTTNIKIKFKKLLL
jgi:uncharacterized ubiquitin-like protein YukD